MRSLPRRNREVRLRSRTDPPGRAWLLTRFLMHKVPHSHPRLLPSKEAEPWVPGQAHALQTPAPSPPPRVFVSKLGLEASFLCERLVRLCMSSVWHSACRGSVCPRGAPWGQFLLPLPGLPASLSFSCFHPRLTGGQEACAARAVGPSFPQGAL